VVQGFIAICAVVDVVETVVHVVVVAMHVIVAVVVAMTTLEVVSPSEQALIIYAAQECRKILHTHAFSVGM
jgi:hypothetical protein